jgi:membrane associated rhomboid family serine protease
MFAWYDTRLSRSPMPRRPRLSTVAYSFSPGPMTPAVKALLYVNIGAYIVSLFFPRILEWFGLVPQLVVERGWLWQPVTYMFLHAPAPTHILFNMLILWMFGVELERTWRTRFFLKFYGITGVGAGLISVLISLIPFAPTHVMYRADIIGASGALYGLLLAFALYYPNREILLFFLVPVPAKYYVAILGALALITSVQASGGVAATTHLGGLIVAYIYLQGGRGGLAAELKYRYLKWKMNRLRRKFDVYAGGRDPDARWDRHVH